MPPHHRANDCLPCTHKQRYAAKNVKLRVFFTVVSSVYTHYIIRSQESSRLLASSMYEDSHRSAMGAGHLNVQQTSIIRHAIPYVRLYGEVGIPLAMYRKYRTGSSGYEPILTIACSVVSVNVVERSHVIDTI